MRGTANNSFKAGKNYILAAFQNCLFRHDLPIYLNSEVLLQCVEKRFINYA